jgi:hypothetical protein
MVAPLETSDLWNSGPPYGPDLKPYRQRESTRDRRFPRAKLKNSLIQSSCGHRRKGECRLPGMAKGKCFMALIRLAASAGAALMALAAIGPATTQAQNSQGSKAPLQLVPGPGQAKPVTRAVNRHVAKAAKPVSKSAAGASRKNARTVAAPSSKAERSPMRPVANAVANPRQAPPATNALRARVAISKPAIRPAATPPPILASEVSPQIFAQDYDAPDDHVMRDGDSVSLVGRLPWWRNDRMQAVTYGSAAAESKVIEAAAVWLAANGMTYVEDQDAEANAAAQTIEVADADAINDIDLAADQSTPPTPTFLQSLLALIGNAAEAVAATARLLFA